MEEATEREQPLSTQTRPSSNQLNAKVNWGFTSKAFSPTTTNEEPQCVLCSS